MAGIFISYRRSDSAGYTGRLMDDLKSQFPDTDVFRDIEAIEAGADFVEAIDRAVGSCSLLLAVIGPRWLSATDAAGKRRIDDDNDFVRLEIATALRRNVRVIPVTVEGATMPATDELPEALKPLARRQAHELSDRRWDYDVDQLFAALEKVPGVKRKATAAPATPPPAPRKGMGMGAKIGIGVAALVVVLVVAGEFTATEEAPPALPVDSASTAPVTAPASERASLARSDPDTVERATPVVAPATTAPARAPSAAPALPAAPASGGDTEASCGRPTALAGTWQWSVNNGAPGILVITQNGDTLTVAEFNGLGQQIGAGTGDVCGKDAQIHISNALWGQFSMTLSVSRGSMTGTVFYQGMQAPVQALRQG